MNKKLISKIALKDTKGTIYPAGTVFEYIRNHYNEYLVRKDGFIGHRGYTSLDNTLCTDDSCWFFSSNYFITFCDFELTSIYD